MKREIDYWGAKSDRDIPLASWTGGAKYPTILTVELYLKWYDLYLVFEDGHVEALHASKERADKLLDLETEFVRLTGESAYCDHAFNPKWVLFIEDRMKYSVASEALELIIGRWELEYKDNYSLEWEEFNEKD
jgi:hypothetical protein